MDWLQIFQDAGVFHKGHFVLKSGLHSPEYFDKDEVCVDSLLLDQVATEILRQFGEDYEDFQVGAVCGPYSGGALLAQCTARMINITLKTDDPTVLTICAAERKSGGGRELRGGNKGRALKDKRVLVVDDVLTTGGSLLETIQAVLDVGGIVAGVGVICNRSGGQVTAETLGLDEGCKLNSIVELDIPTYEEGECPLCAEGVSVDTNLGHGQKFLDAKAAQNASD